jgi:hypothetical protein
VLASDRGLRSDRARIRLLRHHDGWLSADGSEFKREIGGQIDEVGLAVRIARGRNGFKKRESRGLAPCGFLGLGVAPVTQIAYAQSRGREIRVAVIFRIDYIPHPEKPAPGCGQ